ncbi:unnamed protein product [Symbiodinium natans]|uniref:Uncharacterized protein n=1 Tax=Symbiodinium natans TaxID=878477 RepID=A0A812U423_9DINO|nr:unnamed protein product [Symbiodinium natans]
MLQLGLAAATRSLLEAGGGTDQAATPLFIAAQSGHREVWFLNAISSGCVPKLPDAILHIFPYPTFHSSMPPKIAHIKTHLKLHHRLHPCSGRLVMADQCSLWGITGIQCPA